jgi:hypothetical protein
LVLKFPLAGIKGSEFLRIVHKFGDASADCRCRFKGLRQIPCAGGAGNLLSRRRECFIAGSEFVGRAGNAPIAIGFHGIGPERR